ncbi:MAG TPA: TonB-dependent receptor [Nevskiaceae bacterium]|nr:TonB-dependent receptor [Nevskiaceae bacterium]
MRTIQCWSVALCSVLSGAVSAQEAMPATEPAAVPVDAAAPAPESAAAPVASESAGAARIGEIVVTAQKREENLQDVPISINAFSAEQLMASGTDSVKDLAKITPALTYTDFAGYTLIFLRGVGSDAFIPSADPSVATYVDGISLPASQGFAQSLGGVERVEVLKGPQGTLFGRNSTGGAINVVLKDPGFDEPETSLQTSYGTFRNFGARAYQSIPLSDRIGISVAGLYTRQESLYDRVEQPNRENFPDEQAEAMRVKGRWRPLDELDMMLAYQYVHQQGAGSLISAQEHPSLISRAAGITPQSEEYESNIDSDAYSDVRQRILYGRGTLSLPWFDVKILGSDQKILVDDAQYDFDASQMPIASFASPNQYTDQQTGELQFLSNENTWGAEWFRWVAGLYYLESVAGYDPVRLRVAGSVFDLAQFDPLLTGLYSLIPPGLADAIGFLPGPNGVELEIHGLLGTKSKSAFFQGTATLTDWLDLTVGGRYQKEERRLVKADDRVESLDGGNFTILQFPLEHSSVSNFSPKASLDFHLAEDLLVYASWTRGFKSATYNIVNIYTPPDYVKPETVTAIELGTKSKWLDGTLRFNGAVFQSKIKNFQSTFVSLLAGGAVTFENAGSARIRGVDFDAAWVPFPSFDPGLLVTAGGAYLDAKYTSFKTGSGFDETTGLYFASRDFSGNRIVRTPKWSGNLALSQALDVPGGTLELAADVYYNSGFYFTAQNTPIAEENGYSLLNARVTYAIVPWNLRLTVFGNNIGDTRYDYAVFHNDFGVETTLAAPDTYGVRLNWDF